MNKDALAQHLEKLRIFAIVAKQGAFHKASRELRISQPALSRSIATLESIIMKKLLIRSVKGVSLTEEGKLLLSLYEKIEASIDDINEKISSGNHPYAGELKVASYETLVTYLWPDFLKHFTKEHPELKINLITRNEKDHWSKLASGTLDVIVDAEPQVGPQWDSHVLYTDTFNLYVSKKYDEATPVKNIIYVEKAYDENSLSIRDHFVKNDVQFSESYKLDTFISVKAFTLAGLGIGVLPERLAIADLKSGNLKKIPLKGISNKGFGKHRICFSQTQQGRSDLRVKLLHQELKKYLQKSET